MSVAYLVVYFTLLLIFAVASGWLVMRIVYPPRQQRDVSASPFDRPTKSIIAPSIIGLTSATFGQGVIWSVTSLVITAVGTLVAPTGKHAVLDKPVWNVWLEPPISAAEMTATPSRFLPTELEPNSDYALVINLAALSYSSAQSRTVLSADTGPDFNTWLERNKSAQPVELKVVTLADKGFFELRDSIAKPFRVDLPKIRRARSQGVDLPASPFDDLRSRNGDTPFSFGLQSFHIRTLARTGKASIALSIWADQKPVDELALTVCIRDPAAPAPCEGRLASNPMAGIDLAMRAVYPDMALHLVERDGSVVGVLRCNSCGWAADDYREWDLQETADSLSSRILEITQLIDQATGADRLDPEQVGVRISDAGDDLYNVIFQARPPNPAVTDAFHSFVSDAQRFEQDGKPAPSLFVRLMAKRAELILPPIGLMHVSGPDMQPDFVGFLANVQTPLAYQDYDRADDCVSQWMLFVPPETTPRTGLSSAVIKARAQVKDQIAAIRQICPACVIDKEHEFQKWLNDSAASQNVALAILSHHERNALFFNEAKSSPRILSSAVSRSFKNASIVILDACGTSAPGSSDFIKRFNRQGVMAAIATSTQVEPALAGKFLGTLMTLLQRHAGDPAYTISQARFDAVRALGRVPESSYGPQALAFTLAGNGSLRICMPK